MQTRDAVLGAVVLLIGVLVGIVGTTVCGMCGKIGRRGTVQDSQSMSQAIVKLVRQAARWTTAAKQDENSMIAVLHANYGAGYLWALKDIASEDQIKAAASIDVSEFEREIVGAQDAATKRMASLCPAYAPEKSYLTQLGGER